MDRLRTKAISATKWSGISKAASILIQFVRLAVLGRLLSPDDFGLMAMVMVFITFGQFFSDMGMSAAIVQRQDICKTELSSLYWLNIFSGIVVSILFISFMPIIVTFYNESRLEMLLLLMSPIFLITAFGQQFQYLLQKELQFAMLSKITVSADILNTIFAIFFVVQGKGVISLVWASLMSSALRSIWLLKIGWSRWKPQFHFQWKDLKNYWKFGAFQMGERGINYFGWQLDKLLIGKFLGAESLGYYTIAWNLMLYPIQTFNPVITQVAFPVFSKVQNNDEKLRNGYLEIISIIALVMFPIYIGILSVGKPLITVMMGTQWLNSVPLLQILAILGFHYCIGNPLGSLLLAKGRVDLGFYFNVYMFVIYGVSVWLGSRFGIQGVAYALVIAQTCFLFPIGFWIRWMLVKMGISEYIRSFLPFLILSIIMGVMVQIFSNLVIWNSMILELICSAIFGIIIYSGTLWLFKKSYIVNLWKIVRNH